MKQRLQRNTAMTFRVTEEEREFIRRRQKQSGVLNMRHYLLKMAIDGRIIHVELDSVREMNRLLSNIANNVNQVAVKANSTGNVNAADIENIKARQNEIWTQQKEILRLVGGIQEALKKGVKL